MVPVVDAPPDVYVTFTVLVAAGAKVTELIEGVQPLAIAAPVHVAVIVYVLLAVPVFLTTKGYEALVDARTPIGLASGVTTTA